MASLIFATRKESKMLKMGGGLLAVFFLFTWFGGALSQEESKPAQEEKKSENKDAEKKSAQKAVEVEGIISSVGQRTITFQLERKGKVREEVVGIDEKTDIEKNGTKVKLKELQETDKAMINYEPDAYTPASSVKVIGKGEIQKVGGDD
jgi:flagellar biosynthesis component FlhA